MERSEAEVQAGRRGILAVGVWGILGAVGSVIASILGIATVAPLGADQEDRWIDAGAEGALTQEPQLLAVDFELQQGWSKERRTATYYAYRDAQNQVVVLSSQCTHLGCAVRWANREAGFECPCHGGRFSKAGEVVGGPPSHPLMRPPVRIENSRILIERS